MAGNALAKLRSFLVHGLAVVAVLTTYGVGSMGVLATSATPAQAGGFHRGFGFDRGFGFHRRFAPRRRFVHHPFFFPRRRFARARFFAPRRRFVHRRWWGGY